LATIERDNRILLEKMSQIMRTKGRIDNLNDIEYKSLSRERREREMLRIAKENMNMFKRINNKKPAISTELLEKDWNRNLKYMDNISSFAEDWYLRTTRDNKPATARSATTSNQNVSKRSEDNGNTNTSNPSKKSKSTSNEKKKDEEGTGGKKEENKNYEDDFEEN
jgi:hypothetical protein